MMVSRHVFMFVLHAKAYENVDHWSRGAHAFKVGTAQAQLLRQGEQCLCQMTCFIYAADAPPKMFMIRSCSDGCDFSAATPRFPEVVAAVRGAIQLLSSWEPTAQVTLVP